MESGAQLPPTAIATQVAMSMGRGFMGSSYSFLGALSLISTRHRFNLAIESLNENLTQYWRKSQNLEGKNDRTLSGWMLVKCQVLIQSLHSKNSGTLTTEMFWNTFCWKYVLRNLTTGSQMMKTKNSKKICSMVLEKYDKH